MSARMFLFSFTMTSLDVMDQNTDARQSSAN
jgi:hypothetical protein